MVEEVKLSVSRDLIHCHNAVAANLSLEAGANPKSSAAVGNVYLDLLQPHILAFMPRQ